MPYRHKIRIRIFLTYPVLGLLLGLLMLIFLKMSFQSLERQFLDSHLTEKLDYFIKLTREEPNMTTMRSNDWVVFKGDENNPRRELSFLSHYPEGIHELDFGLYDYDVIIKKHNQVRYTLIYDNTGLERLERNLIFYLIIAVFIIFLLAIWYGLWFSKKVIEPVTSLARRIKMMNPEKISGYLSDDYTDDEVGRLALEFDAYSRRLQALVQREREFTANASHELRTPLAVIMAASEGLLSKPGIPEDVVQRIERIDRSAKEMAERLETLLTLARNPVSDGETTDKTDLVSLLDQLIEDHGMLLSSQVRVVKNVQEHPFISAPSPIVSMLMSNLIKNAFLYTRDGTVTISLNQHEFAVMDTGQGIDEKDLGRIFDRGYRGSLSQGSGLGLAISKRICEYHGWRLSLESIKNVGTTVRWVFSSQKNSRSR